MTIRKVKLTKVITQELVLNIEEENDDYDEMADKAWLEFNKNPPSVHIDYRTEVSNICLDMM